MKLKARLRLLQKRIDRRLRFLLAVTRHEGRFKTVSHWENENPVTAQWIRHHDRLMALNDRWFGGESLNETIQR